MYNHRTKGAKMSKKQKEKSKFSSSRIARFPETYLRFFILAIFFFINVGIFAVGITYLGAKYFWIYSLLEIVAALVVINLITQNDNPAYKIAWITTILALPIFGICIYIFFGVNTLKKADMMRLARIERKYKSEIEKALEGREAPTFQSIRAKTQAAYIENTTRALIYENTETKYYPLGDDLYPDMLEALRSAEKYIFLEYFIIERGVMWSTILEILEEKVKKGIDVRIIYDDMGSMITLPHNFPSKMRALGIKCAVFRRFVPVLSSSFNNRDHRKICVVDGKVAFTGGINIADEYINVRERFGHWLDCGIRLRGEAVLSFAAMFLSMWEYITYKESHLDAFLPALEYYRQTPSDGILIPYCDSPCDNFQTGEDSYLSMISQAKRYIYISTPYLAIGYEMISALCRASQSGVDVKIMTPGVPDKPVVHSLSRSYYQTLVKAGVKIYEYQPGFVHAKTFVCDDELAICGTINLDFRSLCLHHECAVWMYKSSAVGDIRDTFCENLTACKEITMQWCKKTPLVVKAFRQILRLFSPLL